MMLLILKPTEVFRLFLFLFSERDEQPFFFFFASLSFPTVNRRKQRMWNTCLRVKHKQDIPVLTNQPIRWRDQDGWERVSHHLSSHRSSESQGCRECHVEVGSIIAVKFIDGRHGMWFYDWTVLSEQE